ncbi:unnamed protein product [Staurois parvus]|uniref:Uncharacterized protein n=1 Tax=Staurois parvus TaxID=386267 RepID=A0ABN9DS98_9NEOB|nr:unnamed protein product [Staurois parvus]
MGPCTDSSCCCQARNLPWAPVNRLLMLLPGPECVMGPCTASHCCCLYRHTLPLVLYGLPLLLPPPPHCGSTLWFMAP